MRRKSRIARYVAITMAAVMSVSFCPTDVRGGNILIPSTVQAEEADTDGLDSVDSNENQNDANVPGTENTTKNEDAAGSTDAKDPTEADDPTPTKAPSAEEGAADVNEPADITDAEDKTQTPDNTGDTVTDPGTNPGDKPEEATGENNAGGTDGMEMIRSVSAGDPPVEETETTGSTTNEVVWDVDAMLATADAADHGLQLMGDGWSSGGPDADGANTFGTDGTYAKAGSTKPSNDEGKSNGVIPTKGCFIQYRAEEDGKLTICEKTQKSNKTFYVVDSQGNNIAERTAGSTSTYDEITVDVTAGETYYAYMAAATANVFQVRFTPVQVVRTWNVEAMLATADAADHGLQLMGDGWSSGGPDADGANTFGTDGTYAKAGSTKPSNDEGKSNGVIPTKGCFIQYRAEEDGKLTICEKTQKSNKTFYVVDSQGNNIAEKTAGSTSTYDEITVDVTAGETYYAYMAAATANVFQVTLTVGEKQVTPWAEVAAPVIDKVSVNEEGKLVVDFTAVIDEYKGAEEVRVIMSYNGYEAASEVLTKQTSSVTFTPLWSGNYTFKVVARRSGEADKSSEEYAYNNYVLPVKKPIVELAQNRGGGAVYLDWINVDGADSFNVYYKVTGADAYTEADKGITDGHITIEGLTAGSSYDFKIEAVRTADGFVSTYEYKDFAVTSEKEQQWFFGTVGSAQETHAVVAGADGTELQTVDMLTKDETPNDQKRGIMPAETEIVNTDKKITFKATGNGKISDGEEGFQYFYTMIDPNKDNFELTATFKLTELWGNAFDNQTGYGIIATDMLGYNYYGTDGLWIKHKQLNSVSTQIYSAKANFVGQRNISGYVSCDTTSVDDVTRETYETKFKNTTPNYEIGAEYTFTLKKTDDAYISICNGEEIAYEDLSILSIQEDGSLCIGVFASRNAGIEVTDITFSTSDSKGVTAADKTDTITPSVAILSSGTTNTSTYEYIYHPNVAGQLTVTAPDGTVVYDDKIEANDVARINVPISVGMNTVTSSLVPDESQKLTNYNTINKTTNVEYQIIANGRKNVYVSPDGKADGAGTREDALDIATAVKFAAPGQRIILMSGSYTGGTVTIGRSVSGTEDNPVIMAPEVDGEVIFEGIGLNIIGSYWHIYGIYVHYPSAVGIQISGNYNTIEMCTVEGSQNTGIQISRSGSVNREPALKSLLWPSYNLVKNCESFDNCDAGRNDADGFAAKLTCGEGNVFYGCIAHHNIDDGWDLFAKAISGEIGKVVIENCVAYDNGWLTYEDTTAAGYQYGEGNGFKLGGNDMYGGHELRNSVSFGNIGKGITSNSCPDCQIYVSTSYGNALSGGYNVGLATKTSNQQKWVVEGLISATTHTKLADQMPFSLQSPSNYIFDGATSHNNQGVSFSEDWFENVDVTVAPERNADGTINMHGLLVLKADVPANSGARLDTTSDRAKSVNPLGTISDEKDLVVDSADQNITVDIVEGTDPVSCVDENGAEVTDVVLRKEVLDSENVKAEILESVKQEVKDNADAKVTHYDLKLYDRISNKVVTLASGKLKITFKYAELDGVTADYNIIVLHEGEKIDSWAVEDGFYFITDGFSVYTVIAVPKTTAPEPTPEPTPEPGDNDNNEPNPPVKDGDDDDDDDDTDSVLNTPVLKSPTSPKTYDDSVFAFAFPSEGKDKSGDQTVAEPVMAAAIPQHNGSIVFWILFAAAAAACACGIVVYRRKKED